MAQPRRRPEEERPEERRPREIRPAEEEERRPAAEERPPISWIAIAGLVIAIIGLFLPVVLALIAGIAGVALGVVALGRIRRGESTGNYLAWGAIVVGAIVALLAFIAILSAAF